MKLEEYRTAKTALEKGASIAPSESKFKKLIDECDLRISGMCILLVACLLSDWLRLGGMIDCIFFCNDQKKRKIWFNLQ